MSDAKTWIGKSQPGDRLDPAAISKNLPAEAGWLIDALNNSKITALSEQRGRASADAARAQRNFRIASVVAVAGTTFGTLASALLLYGAGADAGGTGGAGTGVSAIVGMVKERHLVITVIQTVGLFVAAAAAGLLGSRNYVERWAQKRRQAEAQRREIFTAVLELASKPVPGPSDPVGPGNAIRQALEFFRRYQLEMQIAYFRKSGARHGFRSGALDWVTAALAAFAAVSGALGGLGSSGVVLSASLGITVPIVLSGAQSLRAASRDTDKVAAYEKACQALERAQLDLSEVEHAADAGDAAAVNAYFDRVHLIMASENEAWVPAANVAANQ
jgi:hypothetical protein